MFDRRHLYKVFRLANLNGLRDRQRFASLRRKFYAGLWMVAAARVGATCTGLDFGFQRISRGGLDILVRGAETRLDDHLTLELMGNKLLTLQFLAELGSPVPRHMRFSPGNLQPALDLLSATGRPIVVKPLRGSGGGAGVTTGITGKRDLQRAAFAAMAYDAELLAEEQLEGACYRLLYFDGTLLDAVRRDPPRLMGDGRTSLAGLAARETDRRLSASPAIAMNPLRLDREARHYLAAQGLSPGTVPAAGETVIVKRAINQNGRRENHVVETIHPATEARCGELCLKLGVRFAGVDIIARDIAKPLTQDNGMIGEINTTPALHHHELTAEGRPFGEIAARLLEHMFADSTVPRRRLEAVS